VLVLQSEATPQLDRIDAEPVQHVSSMMANCCTGSYTRTGLGGSPSAARSFGYANAAIPDDRCPPKSIGTRSGCSWLSAARTRSLGVMVAIEHSCLADR